MWTTEQRRRASVDEAAAEVGRVTLGGAPCGVALGGERRLLPVYSPGGYHWRPRVGDQVLVLKAGEDREEPCVMGAAQPPGDLKPGEVELTGGTVTLRLGQEGLFLNGVALEDYVQSIVDKRLNRSEG